MTGHGRCDHGRTFATEESAEEWRKKIAGDGRRRRKPTGVRRCYDCGYWVLSWPS
jgi:hypothetical protein